MNNLDQQAREWYLIHYRHFTAKEAAEYRVHPGEQPTIGMLTHFAQHVLSQQPPAPVNGLSVEQVRGLGEREVIDVCMAAWSKAHNDSGHPMDPDYPRKHFRETLEEKLRSRITALSQQAGEPVSDVEPDPWRWLLSQEGAMITSNEHGDCFKAASVIRALKMAAAPLPDVERLVEAGNLLRDKLSQLRIRQYQMMTQWAEASEEKKAELWSRLHERTDQYLDAIEGWDAAKSSLPKNEGDPQPKHP